MARTRKKRARRGNTLIQRRLTFSNKPHKRLTHYLFRYPAKFHPPVARELLRRYSRKGDLVLDPFCGSGTLLVEAKVLDRSSIGVDIDPVAVFVSKVKSRKLNKKALSGSIQKLEAKIQKIRRSQATYERLQHKDITEESFRRAMKRHRLAAPAIPNIFHWFRRYVVVDMARIERVIRTLDLPDKHKAFFMACFCSAIRNVSNADPVPISGLEVTSHMKRKDAQGRIIDPYSVFLSKVHRAVTDMAEFSEALAASKSTAIVRRGDATVLRKHVRGDADVVITSPPYHNAVDYYRRHTLEMYWLRLVSGQSDRNQLLPRYIGRSIVPNRHPYLRFNFASPLIRRWERAIRKHDAARANAFKHYAICMGKSFASLAALLPKGNKAIFVLGKSSWNGRKLPTVRLFQEVSSPYFRLTKIYWYPLRNRYMTYSRHNGANIDREHVLVFKRTAESLGTRKEPFASPKDNKRRKT